MIPGIIVTGYILILEVSVPEIGYDLIPEVIFNRSTSILGDPIPGNAVV